MIEFDDLNNTPLSKGRILISEPFLIDEYFTRSVVYMCEYNENGAFGLVLNNYVDTPLNKLIQNFPNFDTKISLGGPLETNSLFFIHTKGEELGNTMHINNGIYLGGDYDIVKEYILKGKLNSNEIRFFLGYSGWEEGQLDNELEENSWIVGNIYKNDLMDIHEKDSWKKVLNRMGEKYHFIANSPQYPWLN